jgi:hypothetical protein
MGELREHSTTDEAPADVLLLTSPDDYSAADDRQALLAHHATAPTICHCGKYPMREGTGCPQAVFDACRKEGRTERMHPRFDHLTETVDGKRVLRLESHEISRIAQRATLVRMRDVELREVAEPAPVAKEPRESRL